MNCCDDYGKCTQGPDCPARSTLAGNIPVQTPAPTTQAEFTGVLLHRAEARTTVLNTTGHTVPVLCLDIEIDSALHTHIHVEQPFALGQHSQAEAAARKLTKGMRVTVLAPLLGLRLVAANTTHIHTHHESQ